MIYPTSDHVGWIHKAEGGGKCVDYLPGPERCKHAADALLHIAFNFQRSLQVSPNLAQFMIVRVTVKYSIWPNKSVEKDKLCLESRW